MLHKKSVKTNKVSREGLQPVRHLTRPYLTPEHQRQYTSMWYISWSHQLEFRGHLTSPNPIHEKRPRALLKNKTWSLTPPHPEGVIFADTGDDSNSEAKKVST